MLNLSAIRVALYTRIIKFNVAYCCYYYFYRNPAAYEVFIRYIVIMGNYQHFLLILFALIFFHTTCQSFYEGEGDVTVSRKRVVVFPLGSTFSVSYRNSYCNDIKLEFLNFICTCNISQKTQGFNFY